MALDVTVTQPSATSFVTVWPAGGSVPEQYVVDQVHEQRQQGNVLLGFQGVAGEEGVLQVLEILRRELDEAMLLCGCSTLSAVVWQSSSRP